MVRFQWYTDDGSVGQVLPGNFVQDPIADVCYVTAEIKVQGQRSTVEAQITLPKDFLNETKSIGLALALGERGAQGNSKILAELASSLAKQGYVVVRHLVKFDEQRKQSEIQRTIHACMASPYAQHVEKWILIGMGGSSHISSSISPFFKDVLAALMFAASPLTVKNASEPEVSLRAPEVREDVPILFLHPSVAEACSAEELRSRLKRTSSRFIKYMNIPDVDQNFKTSRGKNAAHLVSSFVVSAVLEFLNVLERDRLDDCLIPSLDQIAVPDMTSQEGEEMKTESPAGA